MAKYWVSFVKYTGVTVEADTEEEAERLALEVPESKYEYDNMIFGDKWQLSSVEYSEED